MLSKTRDRFTYANVIATFALVFAMSGGAYAASKILITSTKQISPKVLKQLAGKTGPKGATGATGATGGTGLAGAAGAKGEPGAPGQDGKEGKEGKEGPEGTEGSPWTAGGVLPAGKTETGTWGVAQLPGVFAGGALEVALAPISFTIPLRATLPPANVSVHIIPPEGKGAGGKTCPTTSTVTNPGAEPGNICLFESVASNVGQVLVTSPGGVEVKGEERMGINGVTANALPETKGEALEISGTWAVTAELE